MISNKSLIKNDSRTYRHFDRSRLRRPEGGLRKPLPHQAKGDLRLGFVDSHIIFGLWLREIMQHILITGRSGSGKSNLLRVIAIELFRLGIPLFII